MAARGLVGALFDELVGSSGRDLDDVASGRLMTLQVREAVAGIDVEDVARCRCAQIHVTASP
jgi:hypothetical protein